MYPKIVQFHIEWAGFLCAVFPVDTMWKIVAISVDIIPVGSPALDVGSVTDDEVHTFDDGIMDVGVDGDVNCDDGFTQTDLCESTLA